MTSAKGNILKFFRKNFFACLTHLCTRDDSLGFEDCRLATHLLNCIDTHPIVENLSSAFHFESGKFVAFWDD